MNSGKYNFTTNPAMGNQFHGNQMPKQMQGNQFIRQQLPQQMQQTKIMKQSQPQQSLPPMAPQSQQQSQMQQQALQPMAPAKIAPQQQPLQPMAPAKIAPQSQSPMAPAKIAPQSQQDYLFYSNKCNYSKALCQMLFNLGILTRFKMICLDNNPNRPPQITKVPTLMIHDTERPLEGAMAFKWVTAMQQFQQNAGNYKSELDTNTNATTNPLLAAAKNMYVPKEGPGGCMPGELNSISDTFAFVGDDDKDRMKNISFLNDKQQFIFTAPEKAKLDNDTQMKRLNMLLEKRKKQQEDSNINVDTQANVIQNGQPSLAPNQVNQILNKSLQNQKVPSNQGQAQKKQWEFYQQQKAQGPTQQQQMNPQMTQEQLNDYINQRMAQMNQSRFN